MMTGVADFIFLIMFCLGKCRKSVSTSRADAGGRLEAGLAGRSSDKYSVGAGWHTCDLLIHLSNPRLHVHSERELRINLPDWTSVATFTLTPGRRAGCGCQQHPLCSRPVRSITRATTYCSSEQLCLMIPETKKGLEAWESHRPWELQNQHGDPSLYDVNVRVLSHTFQWEEGENFPWRRDRMSSATPGDPKYTN